MTSKSDLLRFRDARDAYRLIGECRDLGTDPVLWHQRMFDGLCGLIGAPATSGGEGFWRRPHGAMAPVAAFGAGFDARGCEIYRAYMRELTPARDPVFRALRRHCERLVTRSRRQLVTDQEWYRSVAWNDYHRPANIDDRLTSICQISGESGAVSVLTVHRGPREREFSPRELRLLSFFHDELGRLIGRSLVSATEPGPDGLSPRLRQTLACLLDGDSEKQLAARLGLSHATIHQYVTTLYRHFGVRSRGQLLALMIKRIRREGWSRLSPAAGGGVLVRETTS